MITAHTSARIKVASELYDIDNKMRMLRSYVCFNEHDVVNIDQIINNVDHLVNKVMNAKVEK